MSRCIVVWSGGADSTKLLDDWSRYGSEHSPIHAVTMLHSYVGYDGQAKKEKEAREKIKEYLKSKGRHVIYHEIDIKVSEEVHKISFDRSHGLHQASIWLGNLLPFCGSESRLAFGYVQGDDFWHYSQSVAKVLEGLKEITGALVTIEYPLEWETKADILKYLYREGLEKMVWWCETPKEDGDKCGECSSCKRHDTAMYELRRDKFLDVNDRMIKPLLNLEVKKDECKKKIEPIEKDEAKYVGSPEQILDNIKKDHEEMVQ